MEAQKMNLAWKRDQFLRSLAYRESTRKLFYCFARWRLDRTCSSDRRAFYATLLLMLYMHDELYEEAREVERILRDDPDLVKTWPFTIGDFQPSGLELRCTHCSFRVDGRVENLARYLLDDTRLIDNWLADNIHEYRGDCTFFLMSGSGPSPYSWRLQDVYLKIGHYQKQQVDRDVVQHAIVHEIMHLYLRNVHGFGFRMEEMGQTQFLDEGYAQLCGYRAAGVIDRKRIYADNCARLALEAGLPALESRIENWSGTVFKERSFPLYPCALSFICFLEGLLGENGLSGLMCSVNQDRGVDQALEEAGAHPVKCLLQDWSERLTESPLEAGEPFFHIRGSDVRNGEIVIMYDTDVPLYPEENIFVQNMARGLMRVEKKQPYRFQKQGFFSVEAPLDEEYRITVLFDERVQRGRMGDG